MESLRPTSLTSAQKRVLDFIQKYSNEHGLSPSYRDIQHHFQFRSVGTVQDHLKALRRKGYLEGSERRARALRPRQERQLAARSVPIYGEIAAGGWRASEALELGSLTVDPHLLPHTGFALRVVGNSMIGAGILEGDVVLVNPEVEIRNGDIVVALLDGETTIKRFKLRHGRMWLLPENSDYSPIPVHQDGFRLQGRVVGVVRSYNS